MLGFRKSGHICILVISHSCNFSNYTLMSSNCAVIWRMFYQRVFSKYVSIYNKINVVKFYIIRTGPIVQVHDLYLLRLLHISPKFSIAITTCVPTIVCHPYLVTYSYRSQILTYSIFLYMTNIYAYLVCCISHPYLYNCCSSVYNYSYMPVSAYGFLVNIVCIPTQLLSQIPT